MTFVWNSKTERYSFYNYIKTKSSSSYLHYRPFGEGAFFASWNIWTTFPVFSPSFLHKCIKLCFSRLLLLHFHLSIVSLSLSRVVLPVSVEEVSIITYLPSYPLILWQIIFSKYALNPVILTDANVLYFKAKVATCWKLSPVHRMQDTYMDRIAFVREHWYWCDRLVVVFAEKTALGC